MTNEELLLIDEKMKGLGSLINSQFINVNDKLERIENQVNKTNGRVNNHETIINQALAERELTKNTQKHYNESVESIISRIIAIENANKLHEYQCPLRKDLDELKKDKGVVLGIRTFIVGLAISISFIAGLTYTILNIEKTIREKEKVEFVKKINQLEEEVKNIPNQVTPR